MSNLKKLFKNLQTDSKSVSFTEEKKNDKVIKRLKRSLYKKDKEFVNVFNSNIDFLDDEKKTVSIILTDQSCTILTVHFICSMLR